MLRWVLPVLMFASAFAFPVTDMPETSEKPMTRSEEETTEPTVEQSFVLPVDNDFDDISNETLWLPETLPANLINECMERRGCILLPEGCAAPDCKERILITNETDATFVEIDTVSPAFENTDYLAVTRNQSDTTSGNSTEFIACDLLNKKAVLITRFSDGTVELTENVEWLSFNGSSMSPNGLSSCVLRTLPGHVQIIPGSFEIITRPEVPLPISSKVDNDKRKNDEEEKHNEEAEKKKTEKRKKEDNEDQEDDSDDEKEVKKEKKKDPKKVEERADDNEEEEDDEEVTTKEPRRRSTTTPRPTRKTTRIRMPVGDESDYAEDVDNDAVLPPREKPHYEDDTESVHTENYPRSQSPPKDAEYRTPKPLTAAPHKHRPDDDEEDSDSAFNCSLLMATMVLAIRLLV